MMFTYRPKRMHVENRYKWAIQAQNEGAHAWYLVANLAGQWPLFDKKAEALEAIKDMQDRDMQYIMPPATV